MYIFFAAVLPMWLLKQPRDHMTTFMSVSYTHLVTLTLWAALFTLTVRDLTLSSPQVREPPPVLSTR